MKSFMMHFEKASKKYIKRTPKKSGKGYDYTYADDINKKNTNKNILDEIKNLDAKTIMNTWIPNRIKELKMTKNDYFSSPEYHSLYPIMEQKYKEANNAVISKVVSEQEKHIQKENLKIGDRVFNYEMGFGGMPGNKIYGTLKQGKNGYFVALDSAGLKRRNNKVYSAKKAEFSIGWKKEGK